MPNRHRNLYISQERLMLRNDTRLVGCRVKANCPHLGPESKGRVSSIAVFLRSPRLYLRVCGEKNTENSEQLDRAARSGIENAPSCLPVLKAESLNHRWGPKGYQKNDSASITVLANPRKVEFDVHRRKKKDSVLYSLR